MFCQSCGAECALELNYCSRCGANLTSALAPTTQLVPVNLTKPAVAIGATATVLTLGGFGVLVAGAMNLAMVFKNPDPIMAIIMFGMITILVSDVMLIRLLSRIIGTSLETRKSLQPAKSQLREVPKQIMPALNSVPSVTEHTTRTFAPMFTERTDRGTK